MGHGVRGCPVAKVVGYQEFCATDNDCFSL